MTEPTCAEEGFREVSSAWQRFLADPEFRTDVLAVRHTIEHLTWPEGKDALEQMLCAVIGVALNASVPQRKEVARAMQMTAASSAASVLRDASAWVPDPRSAIMLGNRAAQHDEALRRIRARR